MAQVKLAAGVAVDLATTDDLKASSNSIVDALSGSDARPIRLTQMGQRLGQFSDPMDLGSPPIGRMWFVLSLTVVSQDAFTNPAGNPLVALCIGDVSGPQLGHIRIPNITVPTYRTTSTRGLWVFPNESVYVLTSAVGATVQIGVTCQIEEWNMADVTMSNPGFTPLTS